ncbi:SGNH/GDSL hydrolase family protein [Legionella sp. W05-934-2]|jgi:phospholipase/lecithinase/hemolysin|uniref:SGNH/GDSL hydrolase family protein n=1 Tax=Legionella sp. W05-934-2 TaxID=1198649 RepID=UPI0034618C25
MKRLINLGLICFSLVAKASVPFNHIVVFGDSLSDNGNAFERTQHYVPQTPPYFQGRFSDGPVWIEYIAKAISTEENFLQDYALGGAGVTAENDDIDGVFTLANEVKDFLQNNNQVADEESLYVIWIGANNYLILPDDEDETVDTVKQGTSKALDKLINAGAKHFLVLNLPELSRTPLAKSMGEEEHDKLARYTQKHNAMLDQVMETYRKKHPDVHWYFYNVHQMFNKALETPENYDITNVTDMCFEEDLAANVRLQPVIRMEKLFNIAPPSDCEHYLFFDPVHPTAKAHQIMAKEVLAELSDVFDTSSTS